MATFYSPNSRDPIDTEALAHSRSLSTLSNASLLTHRTLDPHPTDPLLRSPPLASSSSAAYFKRSSRKLRDEDITPAALPRSRRHRTATPIAQKSLIRSVLHGFKRWKKPITLSLEIIIGGWATYNAVRYFITFLHSKDDLGQAFSLSLAIAAGISAVVALWATALSIFISRCISFQDGDLWHSLLLCLRFLAAFFLFVPAAVNVVVVFVWKSSTNPDVDLHARCHLDVDVVWSIASDKCPIEPPSWTLWVALTIIRFLLTASLIAIYLTASFFTFLSSADRRRRHSRFEVTSNDPAFVRTTPLVDHHPSDLTLVTLNSDSSPQRGPPRLSSRSFDKSSDSSAYAKPASQESESDRDLSGFVDRFRSLISQISREMEDGLEEVRSNSPPISESDREFLTPIPTIYTSDMNDFINANDDNSRYAYNMFNLPPLPMALGYNEFGVPYPPDQNIRVLGGFVRRMPTIESMSSGEVTSRHSAGSHRHEASGGRRTSSCPSTRNTHFTASSSGHGDIAGSNPPSRTNSIASRKDRWRLSPMTLASEHGELLGRMDRRLSSPSSGDHTFRSLSSSTEDTMTTYHTAAMGSYSPASVYHDGVRVEQDI